MESELTHQSGPPFVSSPGYPKRFEHGDSVTDANGTRWRVWEQIGDEVCVFVPFGSMTVFQAYELRKVASDNDRTHVSQAGGEHGSI